MAFVKARPFYSLSFKSYGICQCILHIKIVPLSMLHYPKVISIHGQTLKYFNTKGVSLYSEKTQYNILDWPTSVADIKITKLQKLLNCSLNEANDLYEENREFLQLNSERISERARILKHYNITSDSIKENFWILMYEKDELKIRLSLLKKWLFSDPNNGIAVLRLQFKQLMRYTKITEIDIISNNNLNRIVYFAKCVKCDEKKVCNLFMKYTFLMTIKLSSMKEILIILKDQEVLTEDLLSDLWLFRYSLEFISNRAKLLQQIEAKEKCKVIKPWMLRCSETILNRYFELREDNKAALGSNSDIRDLLSNELGLSSGEVDEMIFKHPPLAKISYSKAKDMIDFLKAEGFKSKMIYHVPRVLCHKQATLVARMLELKRISPSFINLQNLCKNKKDYVAFINKFLVI